MSTDRREHGSVNWKRRLLTVAAIVVAVVVGALIASATVPRWWPHQIGDQVDGSITQGILVGLFYGFLFTLLPLAILATVLLWRRRLKWLAAAFILAAVAVVLYVSYLVVSRRRARAGERDARSRLDSATVPDTTRPHDE